MRREFVLFAGVGILAFFVDAGLLLTLKAWVGMYWGRLASFCGAVFFTWILNRRLTFGLRRSSQTWPLEFLRYFVAMSAGGTVNYAVYAVCVAGFEVAARHPVLGVAAGSLAGFLVNFLAARWWVFGRGHLPR